ncbi:MAG: phosphodiester glycosidase family protein [Armatimonadetes bacterium]|nr:phosphodiester glycosidase family protein [Armatimonadota bacterium]
MRNTHLHIIALTFLAPTLAPAQQVVTTTFAGKRYVICRVDLTKQHLDLFWRDGNKQPFKTFDAVNQFLRPKRRQLLFAMNAGMYREDFSPVGLYVENGKQLRPLNLANGRGNFCLKPNGVFALTRRVGASVPDARIVESSRYPALRKSTTLATQSGPMLVIGGKLHPAFRRSSTSRLMRNGVGVPSPRKVVFVISEDPVNFYEFAVLFRDGLSCPNALFLDGNISSLYSPPLHRNDAWAPLGPIIGVTAGR